MSPAQCGTCIWDPTNGERLSTCRGCYERERTAITYKRDDEVTITSVPARAAMNGVRAGMHGIVISDGPQSGGLYKIYIERYQFWWHGDDMRPRYNKGEIANTQFVQPMGVSVNELLYAVKQVVEAERPSAQITALTALRELWERIPQDIRDRIP